MTRPALPDRPVDTELDARTLAGGGIPLRAQRRIQELHAAQSPLVTMVGAQGPPQAPLFTSTLSPAETVVCRQDGLESVSQVMGSSVYHVGWRGFSSSVGCELAQITHAYGAARHLALSRMQQEAMLLRTHAVIGVKVVQRGHAWSGETMEFTAVGTAVRIAGAPVPAYPPLALMEADELHKLHGAGYWPVGIAIGNCFWFEPHADCQSEGSFWSSSLPAHTRAAQTTRHLAVQRFNAFAAQLGAQGVVGVQVQRRGRDHEIDANNQRHTSFTLEIMLMGTAVSRRGDAVGAPPPRPSLVLDLRDRPKPKQSGLRAHGHGASPSKLEE